MPTGRSLFTFAYCFFFYSFTPFPLFSPPPHTHTHTHITLSLYTVTVFTQPLPLSPTNTTVSSLSPRIPFLLRNRHTMTAITTPELMASSTNPVWRRWEVPPYTDKSHSPSGTTLRPITVPSTPKASRQDPQDSSAPPVTRVMPVTETTPPGKTTASDLGSKVTAEVEGTGGGTGGLGSDIFVCLLVVLLLPVQWLLCISPCCTLWLPLWIPVRFHSCWLISKMVEQFISFIL